MSAYIETQVRIWVIEISVHASPSHDMCKQMMTMTSSKAYIYWVPLQNPAPQLELEPPGQLRDSGVCGHALRRPSREPTSTAVCKSDLPSVCRIELDSSTELRQRTIESTGLFPVLFCYSINAQWQAQRLVLSSRSIHQSSFRWRLRFRIYHSTGIYTVH